MSENILSLEDLKFLEELHSKHGIQYLRCDDNGIQMNAELANSDEHHTSLSEISRKLRFRLNSNFQLNFSSGFHFDVVRV